MLNAVSNLIQTQGIQIPASSPTTAKPAAPAKPEAKPAKPSALGEEDRFVAYSRMAGQAAGGGFAAYKLGDQAATHLQELATVFKPGGSFQAALPTLQKLGGTTLKGAGLSALVAAGVSAVSNGVSVVRGKLDGQAAVQNVVTDSIGGAVGGLGAVSAAGAGSLMLRSFGIAGLPLTIGTIAFGALGGVAAGKVAQKLQNPQ